jgi:hypothetical protein
MVYLCVMKKKGKKKRTKSMKEVSKGFEAFMEQHIAKGGKVASDPKKRFEKALKIAVKPVSK